GTVLDRHRLHDHAAHGDAEDVRPLDAEVVEQADGVGRHVGQQVGDLRGLPRAGGGDDGHDVDGRVEAGGLAHVTVVEPDDVEAAVRDRAAELVVPLDELAAEAVHQQHGRVGGVAEGVVGDVDAVGPRDRHGGHGVRS